MYIEIAFFFRPGRGGGEGRGGGVFCVVQILSGKVYTSYYILHTFLTHVIFLVYRLVLFLLFIIFMPKVLPIREVLISRDSGREGGRRHQLGSETKHQQLF